MVGLAGQNANYWRKLGDVLWPAQARILTVAYTRPRENEAAEKKRAARNFCVSRRPKPLFYGWHHFLSEDLKDVCCNSLCDHCDPSPSHRSRTKWRQCLLFCDATYQCRASGLLRGASATQFWSALLSPLENKSDYRTADPFLREQKGRPPTLPAVRGHVSRVSATHDTCRVREQFLGVRFLGDPVGKAADTLGYRAKWCECGEPPLWALKVQSVATKFCPPLTWFARALPPSLWDTGVSVILNASLTMASWSKLCALLTVSRYENDLLCLLGGSCSRTGRLHRHQNHKRVSWKAWRTTWTFAVSACTNSPCRLRRWLAGGITKKLIGKPFTFLDGVYSKKGNLTWMTPHVSRDRRNPSVRLVDGIGRRLHLVLASEHFFCGDVCAAECGKTKRSLGADNVWLKNNGSTSRRLRESTITTDLLLWFSLFFFWTRWSCHCDS